MFSGISKKVIFFPILFINFFQPSKSAEFAKINKIINNRNTQPTWLKLPSLESPSNLQDNLLSNEINDNSDYAKFLKKKTDLILALKA